MHWRSVAFVEYSMQAIIVFVVLTCQSGSGKD